MIRTPRFELRELTVDDVLMDGRQGRGGKMPAGSRVGLDAEPDDKRDKRHEMPDDAGTPIGVANLDVFIAGESVDLCAPSTDPAVIDRWFRWFNRPTVTEFLAQGLFPNTAEQQVEFLESASVAGDRLIVLLRPKGATEVIGVASLSNINHVHRQCDMSIVIGEPLLSADALFFALETKARLTEHAFDVLGVERINSSQVTNLVRWQRVQILFGYQIEGVLRNKFRKGHRSHDVFVSSCLLDDYLAVKAARGGALWPGKAAMLDLLRSLPEMSLVEETEQWLRRRHAEYWSTVRFAVEAPGS